MFPGVVWNPLFLELSATLVARKGEEKEGKPKVLLRLKLCSDQIGYIGAYLGQ